MKRQPSLFVAAERAQRETGISPDELRDDYALEQFTRIYADGRREETFRIPGDVWEALRARSPHHRSVGAHARVGSYAPSDG